MKKSDLTFAEGFLGIQARLAGDNPQKAFDWVKAAQIIKEKLIDHPSLFAEAGLQNDWGPTAGTIFSNGKPRHSGAYLSSNWAIPTLIISYDGVEEEFDCYVVGNDKYDAASTWDEESLNILGINL